MICEEVTPGLHATPTPTPMVTSTPTPSPSPIPRPSDCVSSTSAVDSFNFDRAHLGHSNLGGVGPDANVPETILYKKVGTTAAGVPFDMQVRPLSPYAVNNADINRLTESGLAEINLRGPRKGQGLTETYVELEYCFLNGDTNGELKTAALEATAPGSPVTLSGFQLSFFDFDQSVRPSHMPSLPRTSPCVPDALPWLAPTCAAQPCPPCPLT